MTLRCRVSPGSGARREGDDGEPPGPGRLAEALEREEELLHRLRGRIRAQREAVAEDDLERLDASIRRIQGILVNLREARRARRGLMGWVTGDETTRVGELEEVLGPRAIPPVLEAADDLRAAARELDRELEITRTVLETALETGDDLLRELLGGDREPDGYAGTGATTPGGARDGGFLNRRA